MRKRNKKYKDGKEDVKLSLFKDDYLYRKPTNPRAHTHNLQNKQAQQGQATPGHYIRVKEGGGAGMWPAGKTQVKMPMPHVQNRALLPTPLSCSRALERQQWWFECLGSCHPHGKPGLNPSSWLWPPAQGHCRRLWSESADGHVLSLPLSLGLK